MEERKKRKKYELDLGKVKDDIDGEKMRGHDGRRKKIVEF
jgi:hypothetical protein